MIAVTGDQAKLLSELLQRASNEALTYPEHGETRSKNLPPGYTHDRQRLQLGQGEPAWIRAQEAIVRWRPHHYAGLTVTPSDASLEEGNTVLVSRGLGPLLVVAPCRIVYVTRSDLCFGFGYGTLPGHPERGEEAFHVLGHEDGTVTAEIAAFSHPADLPTRIAGPVARQIQKAATQRYLKGIRAYVAEGA